MRTKKLTIAEFGDIHLGHPNTPTDYICRNLINALPDTPKTGEIDLLILAGDVFDRQLAFGDLQIGEIQMFVHYLLKLCKRWDIVLRVLEGTPSHDWRQSRVFETVNTISGIDCDLKYVSTLSIERIERFGIDVLYVPDEWRPTCDQTWVEVNGLLKQHSIDKVDFAIMHGCFPHQMPELLHKQLDMHRSERYLGIVRELIFVGHIHRHSQYERILAAGSFDRLCHGEEEAKGHIRVTCHPNQTYDIDFVTNTHARVYVTVDCQGLANHELADHLQCQILKHPKGSAIRLQGDRQDEAILSIEVIRSLYIDYHITTKVNRSEVTDTPLFVLEHKQKVVSLNRDTLKTLLLDRIKTKHATYYNRCESLVSEVLG